MPRYFDTGDHATDVNLQRLDHFASVKRFDGTASHVHDWIVGVMESSRMLPPALARMVPSSFYAIGDAHYRWSDTDRPGQWKRLVDHLAAQMEKVVEAVGCDGKLGIASVDLSGRKVSRGERISEICTKLMDEGIESTEGARMLREIAFAPVPGISSDLRELERLAKLKRKPGDYPSKVMHHLYHMRIVASGVHWMD